MHSAPISIAAIVIGRNEGDRLVQCLTSLRGFDRIVYVDSGSTDGSVEMAQGRGVEVVALDMRQKFTAARARNAGIAQLSGSNPPEFVQFLDGDCELQGGWLDQAKAHLIAHPDIAVVCGRRRERFPDASLYNAQCDREWDTPIGQARACGGDALMRFDAVQQVGGYNPGLIAGEEPEMCVRLRAKGWKIWRIDVEMALHDAAMTRFSQYWKRARRSGHAFAEGAFLHGSPPEKHFVSETKRSALWGLGIPALIVFLSLISPWALMLIWVYPAQILRMARRDGFTKLGWQTAILLTLAKFAEGQGVLEFHLRRLLNRPAGLIEYK
ncbi:glycosyltransferase family 2 protein [Aestuariibius sp. HNIBRBA575]|uniref:glycosyltransferase n=1 Tax=Aestuariibius sp. HNIBRBA575 TaxID=3233343 RepID=UPI0034A1513C